MTLHSIAKRLLVSGAGAVAFAGAASAADISGAGATFPYPIYAKWADAYKKHTGVGLNYQSIGSGGGIKQIKAKTVTFGASDMPLKPEDLKPAGLVQFPMIIGGVVPVVNIKGIAARPAACSTAPRSPRIYLGEITKWNDPRDQEAQSEADAAEHGDRAGVPLGRLRHEFPVLRLPVEGQPEIPIDHRRQHLGAMADRHRRQGQRGRGQHDDADRRRDRLRRVRLRQAEQDGLRRCSPTRPASRSRRAPSRFQAAAANADWAARRRLLPDPDRSGRAPKSWPITGASFILVYKQPAGSGGGQRSAEVLRLGLQGRRARWRPSSTTCRCPQPLIAQVQETWKIADHVGRPPGVDGK